MILRPPIHARTLNDAGIPGSLVETLLGMLPEDTIAAMIYGSRARGDALPTSDLDALALVPTRRPPATQGAANLSFYTPAELRTGIGSLFGYHLNRDGLVFFDPTSELQEIIQDFKAVDSQTLLTRILQLSVIFDCTGRERDVYIHGLARQARYFLRSAMYIQAIESGTPCFSIRELAIKYDDPLLQELLMSRRPPSTDSKELTECLTRLQSILGPLPANPYQSLEGLALENWGNGTDLATVLAMTMANESPVLPYSEMRKILL